MWAEACEMLTRADRLHRQFFQLGKPAAAKPTWQPPVDIFETDAELRIIVALPGVEARNLEVDLDSGELVIAAERPLPAGARPALIHRLEIPYGRLERRIDLPQIRMQLVKNDLLNGCLTLVLRKL
ncbi:MAG: Hsp20/alpha crystallin family protein [Pseudomonadota bacterium]|nr:Hsp20/alpha crystallin family protein [Burkholderiales bacterium]MDQ3195694.1 Hsp20/alpha crystallin family protein [Pseudomonadota bacterium]